jgi:hypothetical protein
MQSKLKPVCSFCLKPRNAVGEMLTAGIPARVFICNECIERCYEILGELREQSTLSIAVPLAMPEEDDTVLAVSSESGSLRS